MSILPLTIEGETVSLQTNVSNFDPQGTAIHCRNLDIDQLNSSEECNISYDLRVGSKYRDHRDAGGFDLQEGDEFTINPGMAVIVQTEEWVQVPKSYFGQITPKVSLLQKGISNTHSKIDPGYVGHLLVTVFNLGMKPVTLKYKQRFCSMFFVTVSRGIRPYSKPPRQIEGRSSRGIVRRGRDFIQTNSSWWALLAMLLSSVAALLAALK